jgi:gliding motility-associated-like protein
LSASTTAAGLTASCTLPANLQNGLVGYWPFCGNANDASGNGNNGTVNGATLTTDRFGNANSAYSFDGNNFISTNIIPSNISQRSYSAWFKTTTGGAIIGSNSANNTSNLVLAIHTNGTSYGNEGTALWVVDSEGSSVGWMSSLPTNNLYNDNLWHNITGVFNSISGNIISPSNLSLYVDGVLITIIEQNVNPSISPINILNNIVFGYNKRWISNGYGVKFDGVLDDISIWNRVLSIAEITQLYNAGQTTYLWSTGETTASISPSPTATTTYWCDVTVNGSTCRKELTITVNSSTPAPTASATQTFCAGTAITVANLSATGTGVQWYDAATGGNLLASTAALTDGQTVYASQTENACESTTRTAVTVSVNDPQITASATTICAGTAVNLSASTTAAGLTANCALPANLQNGLVGYWPFCGNANDASINGNNGTVNGATLTTDRFGNSNGAFSFNGVNSYISVQDSNTLHQNVFTISSWVNGDEYNGFKQILSKNIGTSNNESINLVINNNSGWNLTAQIGGLGYYGTLIQSPNTISEQQWHHVVYVYNENNQSQKLFLDGVLVANNTTTDLIQFDNKPLTFGAQLEFNVLQYFFNGKIDDVGYWNRELNQQEITQIYNSFEASYLWSTGETTASINPSPTATTTYWCDVTVNGTTCRKEVTITVNPNVTPLFTQVAPICAGATLAALPTTSNNSITGTWSPAMNNAATTLYTFTPTAGLCATTATMTITVNPNITPTFTQVAPICAGGTLAALPISSANGITGTWSPALNNAATTLYTFTPTAGLCATTATMTITVNPNITPTFTQVAPICAGGTLAALPISSANGITGTWSPALNNAATTLYTFTPTAGLCATTATMSITINPIHTIALSSATATETQSLCVSTALSPITYTLGGGATGANVTGLPTGVTATVAGTTLTISGTPTTTTGSPFTFSITTTGNTCTAATGGGTITINPIQTIVLTSVTTSENQTLCINTAITPITYTLGGGATGANVTGLPAGVTATVAGTTLTISGTPISTAGSPYVFNITTTGSICLVATDSGTMIVNPIPVLNPISNQDYCPSVLVPASNWITVPPGSTYVWTNSTTTIGLAASGFGSAPSFTSANSTTTQQIATIDITPTLNGCVGSVASYTITVNPTLTPQFTFGTLVQLCEGSTPPALPLSTTNTPPISGSWSPSSISSTASGNYVFTPSPGLCVVPATLQVLLSPLPVVSLPQDGIVCVTQAGVLVSSYTLDTQLNPSQYSFVWSTSTGVLPAETNPSLLVPAAGTYSVQVTNTSSLCSNSATAVVGSIVTPESATISYSAFFSSEQVVTVNVVPAGDYLYQLDNGPFQSSNYFYNIPTGDHTITVKNECAELAPIPFRIVDYPKFFTPNNDGFNDLWNVFDLADQPDATIYLFDRYGKLLKQMSTVGDGWDGTYNSAEMPSTDYWFKINYKENGQFKEFKSHFSLKR